MREAICAWQRGQCAVKSKAAPKYGQKNPGQLALARD
jgi:hypothetical protein